MRHAYIFSETRDTEDTTYAGILQDSTHCEACGGDGQIECGAYRGDTVAETRNCALCNREGQQVAQREQVYEQYGGSRYVGNVIIERPQREKDDHDPRNTYNKVPAGPITLENTGRMTGDDIIAELRRKGVWS